MHRSAGTHRLDAVVGPGSAAHHAASAARCAASGARILIPAPNSTHDFTTPRRNAPESCMNLSPLERAWGMPGARCTRGLVCNCSDRTHTSNNEYTGIARHSRTQWFYGLCRALVSAKFARMCERAVLTNRPSLNLSPFVLEGQEPAGERGTDPVSSSTRTVARA